MKSDLDDEKEAANRAKHGLDFAGAVRLDCDAAREVEDLRYDYGERRWRVIGRIDGCLHVLVYTVRDDAIRILSLKKANPREARLYAR